ncbi:hypothetical protein OF846_004004 [Rhodotorula toruloides]|nr:hypothetical protein OF846_004004 [Rhodotorula toruloides]
MSSTLALASRALPVQTLASAVLTAAPTPFLLSDDHSNAIYSALVAYVSRQAAAPVPTTASLAHVAPISLAASPAVTGFLTSRLADLPEAVGILLGVWLILLALVSLVAGTRLLIIGADAGTERGNDEKKGWLAGGVGGMLFGSVALGAVSTLLLLLILSEQSSSSLGGWATLAIILIPGLLGAVVAGRWRWAAKGAYGFLGGLSFTLLLITSLRLASITARLAILAVFLVLPAVFIPCTERYGLSIAAAATASYLLVLGIDIFCDFGFVDALGLLVAKHGVSSAGGKAETVVIPWASTGGKGLIAAWWILFLLSAVWQTWWGLGDEGDKTWNAYLSHFISTHPSTPSGTHLPPPSLKERLFAHLPFLRRSFAPSAFTDLPRRRVVPWDDRDDAASTVFDIEKGFTATEAFDSGRSFGRNKADASDAWDSDVETLAGFSSRRRDKPASPTSPTSPTRVSKPAQYGTISTRFSDDEDDEVPVSDEKDGLWTASRGSMDSSASSRPSLQQRMSSSGLSGSTAVSYRSRELRKEVFEEIEEDEGEADLERDAVFPLAPTTHKHASDTVKSKVSGLFRLGKKTAPAKYKGLELREAPSGAVPATPSLIRAIDRIKVAQQQARGAPLARHNESASPEMREALSGGSAPARKPSVTRERRASMDDWWSEVVKKSEGQ